jgi:hypothetical protein
MFRLGSRVKAAASRSFATYGSAFLQPRPNKTLLYVGIGAGVGVLAIAAVQTVSKSVNDSTSFERPVQKRLQSTYGYLAASLAGTAVLAGVMFRR